METSRDTTWKHIVYTINILFVVLVTVFSEKILETLDISPLFLLLLLVIVIIFLFVVRVYGTNLKARPKISKGGENEISSKNKLFHIVDTNNLEFPLAIIGGILITVPIILVIQAIYGTGLSHIFGAKPYEIAAALVGFVLCGYLQFSGDLNAPKFFWIGVGLGQAVVVIALAGDDHNLLLTLVFTPLAYLTFSITIEANSTHWWKLLAPIVLILLYLISGIGYYKVVNWYLTNPSDPSLIIDRNDLKFFSKGTHEVYYLHPFPNKPNLRVVLDNPETDSVRFQITNQENDYFEIEIMESNYFPVEIYYEAISRVPTDTLVTD